ncbi:prepilin peptidase [Geobacter argillaceus]|uniref:Prepilin leader peptidase/N-methyltransferase n=1 Tax=Geobacter argillaceus TaxID=345631 RepID=A0A562WR16_9BACT|nr:A24 family peptidase [Geobacter argillaceus]TWJ32790.1 type 4 prepilin peptidase 1 [Geobacter argillaceus]
MPLPIQFYIFAFLFGAVVGSFLNVCICRLPEGRSVVFPPSACPSCGAAIRWYDNIPIVSYLVLRGRCRSCSASISWRYPLVETLNGLLTLVLFLRFGPSLTFLALFLFCSALVAITFIDFDHQIIPDVISLPGIVVGFVFSFFLPWLGWRSSLIGIVAGGGVIWLIIELYYRLRKEEGMGGGDVKLLAMIGAFLGWRAILFTLFAASLVGSVVGVSLMFLQKKDGKLAIPFGPYLAFGAVLYIFYGKQIIYWYLNIGR